VAQVVVIWRDIRPKGQHEDLKRAYGCPILLCEKSHTIFTHAGEPPPEFSRTATANITPIGLAIARALFIPGIRQVCFECGYMCTVSAFNQIHGVFTWDAGLHRAVMRAFTQAGAEFGYKISFRREGTKLNDPDDTDAAVLADMEERLNELP
jgi:hypothetical protein